LLRGPFFAAIRKDAAFVIDGLPGRLCIDELSIGVVLGSRFIVLTGLSAIEANLVASLSFCNTSGSDLDPLSIRRDGIEEVGMFLKEESRCLVSK
jgi:hypothetical protein